MRTRVRLRRACLAAGLASLCALPAAAQDLRMVAGSVVTPAGRPIAGASLSAGARHVAADSVGAFVLAMPATESLVVRAPGFRRAVVASPPRGELRIALEPEPGRLVETLTAAAPPEPGWRAALDVAAVTAPPPQPLQYVVGSIAPALTVAQGRPGADAVVVVPPALPSSGAPLILIDGVPAAAGTAQLDPAAITGIEVLGAAAAAVHGARAGNGVIAITTRAAADSPLRVTLAAELAEDDVAELPDRARNTPLLLDAAGTRFCVTAPGAPLCAATVDWSEEIRRINTGPGDTIATPATLALSLPGPVAVLANRYSAQAWPAPSFPAAGALLETARGTRVGAQVSGRVRGVALDGGLTRLDQPGGLPFQDGYTRLTARLAARGALTRRLQLDARVATSTADDDGPTGYENALAAAARMPRAADLSGREASGRPFAIVDLRDRNNWNPIATRASMRDRTSTDRTRASLRLDADPGAGFALDATLALDRLRFERSFDVTSSLRLLPPGSPSTGGFLRQRVDLDALAFYAGAHRRVAVGGQVVATPEARVSWERATQDAEWMDPFTTTVLCPRLTTSAFLVGSRVEIGRQWVVDARIRRDQVSRTFATGAGFTGHALSVAWRAGGSPIPGVRDVALHAAIGSAGGAPLAPLHEVANAVDLAALAAIPGRLTTREAGAELQLPASIALRINHVRGTQHDALAPMGPPAQGGIGLTLVRVGDVETRATAVTLRMPLVARATTRWDVSASWLHTDARYGATVVPPFLAGRDLPQTLVEEGGRVGAFAGRRFATACADLPATFQAQCGASGSFQRNDDGYLVWVGAGNSWRDGITRNLWGTQLPGAGAPWGVPLNWGAPILVRDTACVAAPSPACPARQVPLGNALPARQFTLATTAVRGRVSASALVHGTAGRRLWNAARHLAALQFNDALQDQAGRSVETAKPIGYYWREGAPNGAGYGGLYSVLAPNSHYVESADFVKLRELSLTVDLGHRGDRAAWSLTLTGRNLVTLTDFTGYDPEVPLQTSPWPGDLNGRDDYRFPVRRSLAATVTARF